MVELAVDTQYNNKQMYTKNVRNYLSGVLYQKCILKNPA